MLRNRRLTAFALMALLFCTLCGVPALATESKVGFFVTPQLPANQMNPNVGFFSLLMKPEQEQTLQVLITNENDEEIKIAIEVNDAFTNQHGVIDYSAQDEEQKPAGTSLSGLVEIVEPVLRVPAKGSAMAKLQLRMPKEPFEGELLGGILFTRIPDETTQANEVNAVGGIQIINVFRYCIAIQATQDSKQNIQPDFDITNTRIGMTAGFPTLVLDIANLKPIIAIGATLDAAIYPENAENPVFSFEAPLSMVPGGSTSFAKLLIDTELPASGNHRVKGTLRYREQSWQFELPLVVD